MAAVLNHKKEEKIFCYYLNGKRNYKKERKMAKLFSEILNEINIISYKKQV